ncbi:MAG: LysR family transcriptional regulator [Pseudomonadota bacterium]
MQTRSLHTLARIARMGSFAKVAEEQNTTLSTVSMQMKALEELLGVNLFDRAFRPPKLTPLGRVIAKHAETVTTAEAELLNACSETGELSGTFRMGFIATASVRLLPTFLLNAAKLAPKAEFELETALSEILETRVLAGQLDAAVVTASGEPQNGLHYQPLQKESLVFALPESHSEFSAIELAGKLPFLQFNPSSGIGKLIEKHMRELSDAFTKEAIVLDSVEAIMECVNKGLGFTLLSEPDIRRYASDKTRLIEPEKEDLSRSLVLASNISGTQSRDIEQIAKLFNAA